MSRLILGLDLGVGSIGWALVKEEDINGEIKTTIVRLGVRTISYPTFVKSSDGSSPQKPMEEYLKGVGLSSNVGRSKMHGSRIRLQRYKLRRKHLREVLEKHGIITTNTLLCEDGSNTTHETYSFRAKAVEEKISLEQFARVLMMINKKRGFKSNRKDAGGDENGNESEYKQALNQRSRMLNEEGLTVGQWKYRIMQKNPHFNFRNIVFYRQDYLDEFEKIWNKQSQYHPQLTEELKEEIRDIIIFYQRKLRSKKSEISYCRYESTMKDVVVDKTTGKKAVRSVGCRVAPKSSPLFQEFRIWQNINNILLSDFVNHSVDPLSPEDKQKLYELLKTRKTITKEETLKALNKKKTEYDLNFDKIEGDRTRYAILKVFEPIINDRLPKKSKFFKLTPAELRNALNRYLNEVGAEEDLFEFDFTGTADGNTPDTDKTERKELEKSPYFRLWHLLYSYEGDESRSGNETLINILHGKYNFPLDICKRLANVKFEPDYAALSAKAIRKLLPYMRQGMRYDEACSAVGYSHSDSMTKEENDKRELKPYLDLVPRNSLRNPVVEKVLNQMANVVNQIIQTYGKPDEVRIELARELKKNNDQRKRMSKSIKENEERNEKIRKILEAEPYFIKNPSRNDIIKYRLYEELASNKYNALYSNKYISPQVLFTKEIDIEHIIPKAKLFNDSYPNKTLEFHKVNHDKGNMTALDYMEEKRTTEVADYRVRVETLYKNKHISKAKRDFLLMKEADIPEDFLNRDLSQSQYIARQATSMLKEVIRDVHTTTGSITKKLREDWELVDLMKEMNWDKYKLLGLTEYIEKEDGKKIKRIKDWTKRDDHRHHAVDALVIALTKPAYVQYLNNVAASTFETNPLYGIRNKYTRTVNKHRKFLPPMPNLRQEAKKNLESIFISTKVNAKVTTKSINKTGGHFQTTLTPRGQLHEQSYYGRRMKPEVTMVRVDGKLTKEKIETVTNTVFRMALLERLDAFGGDPKKAFTGKNSIEKNPIWIDKEKDKKVPSMVKTLTYKPVYVIRKAIGKDLNVSSVLDEKVRTILQKRIDDRGGTAKKAFVNLDNDPIWLDENKTIPIKKVITISPNSKDPVSLHDKKDHMGQPILGSGGIPVPTDYVATRNNHHSAIYIDANGVLHDRVVSLFEAVERRNQGLPVVDKSYNAELGWTFLFCIKKDEYFVFPDPSVDFYPKQIDLKNPENAEIISKNMFRVQNISSGDYVFRHHLETRLRNDEILRNMVWKRIQNLRDLKDAVKVRINHIGDIVEITE